MAETTEKNCLCDSAPTLIFACSGAADVGAVADQAARALTREGVGKMYCLAGVGGRVEGILTNTAVAGKILAIDGCPMNCVHHTLEQAGFRESAYVRITDLGMEKGKSPANEENVGKVMAAAKLALAKAEENA